MVTNKLYGNFRISGKEKNKTQLVLGHTHREINDYLKSIETRYNGKYDKIPNFIISKKGELIQLLPETAYSNYFHIEKVNRKSIFIVLENLGWLEKKPLSSEYINWNGSIYKGQVYEKKWRDFFFWDPYSQVQMERTAKICSELLDNLKINKGCVGHNTKIDGISLYEGITSKSNYDQKFTDLNPSFNFEILSKNIENEQFV